MIMFVFNMWASQFGKEGNKPCIHLWLTTKVQVSYNVSLQNPWLPKIVYFAIVQGDSFICPLLKLE